MEGPIGRSVLSLIAKGLAVVIVVFLIVQVVHPNRLKDVWHYYVYSPRSAIGSLMYGMVRNPYSFLEMSVQAERLGDFASARRFMAYGIFLLAQQGDDKVQLNGFRARLVVMEKAIVPPYRPFEGDMLLGPPPAASAEVRPPAAGVEVRPPTAGVEVQPPTASVEVQPPAASAEVQPPAASAEVRPPAEPAKLTTQQAGKAERASGQKQRAAQQKPRPRQESMKSTPPPAPRDPGPGTRGTGGPRVKTQSIHN